MTNEGVGTPTPQYDEVPLRLKVVLAKDEDLLALAKQAQRLTHESEN